MLSGSDIGDMIARKSGAFFYGRDFFHSRTQKGARFFQREVCPPRGLADSLARELWPQDIHVAHIIIDGVINRSDERKNNRNATPMLKPDDIAETYWTLVEQKRERVDF